MYTWTPFISSIFLSFVFWNFCGLFVFWNLSFLFVFGNFCGLFWKSSKWFKLSVPNVQPNWNTHKKKKAKRREQMRWGNHMVINLFPFFAHAIFDLIFKSSVTIFRSHYELKNRNAAIIEVIIFHLLKNWTFKGT